jgi:hypothetical protein
MISQRDVEQRRDTPDNEQWSGRIEPTRAALPELETKRFDAIADAKCD